MATRHLRSFRLRDQARYFVLLPVLLVCGPVWAQNQATNEVDLIRREMEQLRRDYEQRLRMLEDRLKQVETRQAAPPPVAPSPRDAAAEPAPPSTAEMMGLTNVTASGAGAPAGVRPRGYGQRQFQRETESRQRALAVEQESIIRERVEHVLEEFVDITGYFRSGYGKNNRGGSQTGFQAPGAFAKYRLGNEAEMYGELGFGKNFYVPSLFALDPGERPTDAPTGAVAHVQILMSMYNPYEDLLSASGTDFGLPEAWASIGNVVPGLPDMKIWAGSRFYRRHDIHINDFYFYNMSGAGGGVEDIQLPFGKFAAAWIGAGSRSGISDVPEPDPENRAGFSKSSVDLRLYDVPVPLGRGEFGVALAQEDTGRDVLGRTGEDSEGIAFTALHTREKFISLDGINKFSLQFGTGPAKTFTSGFEQIVVDGGVFIRPDARNSWRFRATEHFTANLGDHFSIGPALIYQLTDYGDAGGIVHWASAGVRPILHFNRYLSLAFEGGLDWVKDEDADTSDYLYKLTLAPQVSLGSRFMSRPVVRFYMTYAGWGEDFVGRVGGNDYINDSSGWTYGMQMEVWW